jgi:hypothetical protein
MFSSPWTRAPFGCRSISAALLAVAVSAVATSSASAGPGYAQDPASIALGAEDPHSIAIDQVSQDLYVTELTTDFSSEAHGQIEQFDASGTPTVNSPFVTGGSDYFTGVAVNPVTQGIYAYQAQLSSPEGPKGTSQMNTFSSTGAPGTSFSPSKSTGPQIAADSAGRVYYPNDSAGAVQVFDSTGALKDSIPCTGCPGGPFGKLTGVALDSAGNLYAVDIGQEGRVVKFEPSGASFAYDSILQSGEGAVAVAVDPSSNDVFVGDLDGGTYHVLAYDSTGVQFDDFGGGVVGGPPFGPETSGQIAASAATHKVYVADPNAKKLWIFDRVASIPAPTATTTAASSLGQVKAILNASVNPKGHGLRDCHFEYTDHADFLLNEFANATSIPCSTKPYGSTSAPASVSVGGLAPATDYDYRIAVTSNGGSVSGSAQSFETLPPLAPTPTTGSASLITMTSATIAGTVNAHGGPISDCHFEYTSEPNFQKNGFTGASSKDCAPVPNGTTNVAVSAKISALTAATSYRFRLVATNNSGTAEAVEKTFQTQAETCATNSALCPPPAPEETPAGPALPAPVLQPLPVATRPPVKPLKCRKGFKKKKVHGKAKCVKIKKRKHRSA